MKYGKAKAFFLLLLYRTGNRTVRYSIVPGTSIFFENKNVDVRAVSYGTVPIPQWTNVRTIFF